MATVLLTVLHWDQAGAVFGLGGRPDWRIRQKRRRLSARYRSGVLAAVTTLVAAPCAEELTRCLRATATKSGDASKDSGIIGSSRAV